MMHQRVTSAIAEDSGALTVTFANKTRVRVEPDERYDAGTFAGSKGEKVVCMSGGELAIWVAIPV
ncbi:MAG: DUF6188 family protein [Sciscionella sp.]